MAAWGYANPVEVSFGWGALEELPRRVGKRDAILVTFPEAKRLGVEARLEKLLGERLCDVISDVAPLPEIDWFTGRYSRSWSRFPEAVIVAVGGGSVIDTAKMLQVRTVSGRLGELKLAMVAGREPDVAAARHVIAVPTTAGTGSEVTPWATVWNTGSAKAPKLSLHSRYSWAECALVDPELTVTLPPLATRDSALDALSHALESIWNVNANPVSDTLAVEAARTVIATLPQLRERPADRELRTAMARGALMAGLAFSNTKTALAHSISYGMTLKRGLSHGLACSFTLPMVWRMAAGVDAGRDRVLARVFSEGERDPPGRLEAFLHGVGVGTRFADHGVEEGEGRRMVEAALEGARGRNFVGRRVPAAPQPA